MLLGAGNCRLCRDFNWKWVISGPEGVRDKLAQYNFINRQFYDNLIHSFLSIFNYEMSLHYIQVPSSFSIKQNFLFEHLFKFFNK